MGENASCRTQLSSRSVSICFNPSGLSPRSPTLKMVSPFSWDWRLITLHLSTKNHSAHHRHPSMAMTDASFILIHTTFFSYLFNLTLLKTLKAPIQGFRFKEPQRPGSIPIPQYPSNNSMFKQPEQRNLGVPWVPSGCRTPGIPRMNLDPSLSRHRVRCWNLSNVFRNSISLASEVARKVVDCSPWLGDIVWVVKYSPAYHSKAFKAIGHGRGGPLTISDVFFIDSLYDPLSSQVHIYWILFVSFGILIRSIRICSSGSLGLPRDLPRSPQWLGSVPVLARFTQQKRSQRSYMVLQYQLPVRDVVVVRLDSE